MTASLSFRGAGGVVQGLRGPVYYGQGVLRAESDSESTNAGTILLDGGAGGGPTGYGGANGGTLLIAPTDRGSVFSNSGTIEAMAGDPATGLGSRGAYTAGTGAEVVVSYGGELDNSGTMEFAGGRLGREGAAAGRGAQLVVGAGAFFDMTTGGTLGIDAGTGGTAATLTLAGDLVIDAGSVLRNDGVIALQGGSIMGAGGASLLSNTGTITGGGEVAGTHLVNDGTIDVGNGNLTLNSCTLTTDAGRHGVLQVDAGGIVSLAASPPRTTIDGGQTLVLTGPGAVARLDTSELGIAVHSSDGTLVVLYGGTGTLAAGDSNLVVVLDQGTNLTLSRMAMVTAIGSSGGDTITALAAGQTLSGGGGTDLLVGSAATGDRFQDTAAGLNGDVIAGFAGSDAIDVTNIAAAGATLAYTGGTLTVSGSGTSTAIALPGNFTTDSFTTATDGRGGVLITLHT